MSQRSRIVQQILDRRLSAIIRTADQQLAADAMQAAVAGGFRVVEFTLTTPGAIELICEFSRRASPAGSSAHASPDDGDLLVGAGTVLTVAQARAAVAAGARFLVSPICDPAIIAEAKSLDVVAIPGTFTATEMQTAHLAGADFCKLFPAPHDVPGYVAAILAPLPHLRIYPTNGVTLENVCDVLRAGAAGCGFVKPLFEPQWLAQRDFESVRRRAQEIVARVAAG